MEQSQLILLAGFIVLMAMAIFLVGLGRRRGGVNIEERLATFGQTDRSFSVLDEELSASFSVRVLKPAARSIFLRLSGLAPSKNIEKTRAKLAEAGYPSGLGVAEFLGLKLFLALVLAGGGLLLFALAGSGAGPVLLMVGVLGFFGYIMPSFWLGRKSKQRRKEILRSMPDAIDLLTISVESGLGFDPAIKRVAEKWDNALTREFARMLSEIQIGKSRRDALREMADRVNVDDLRVFVSSVVQADQLGVAISQVMRIQSEAMRLRRRQRAEEAAHKAPIKMLFPMVFLIFPAMWVVVLGPAFPILAEVFGNI
jgi:tight adherence protein C